MLSINQTKDYKLNYTQIEQNMLKQNALISKKRKIERPSCQQMTFSDIILS